MAELSAGGWLLGPFTSDGLWQPITPAVLTAVHWPAVVSQAAAIAAIVLISTVGLLLNAGGLELAVDSDLDFDKELRVAGAANALPAWRPVAGIPTDKFFSLELQNRGQ